MNEWTNEWKDVSGRRTQMLLAGLSTTCEERGGERGRGGEGAGQRGRGERGEGERGRGGEG